MILIVILEASTPTMPTMAIYMHHDKLLQWTNLMH